MCKQIKLIKSEDNIIEIPNTYWGWVIGLLGVFFAYWGWVGLLGFEGWVIG
jgi:hypothetical protein